MFFVRSILIELNVYPWALLIVIQNATLPGNCRLLNVKGYTFSQYKVKRLIKTISPVLSLVNILHHNTLTPKSKIINFVLLYSPSLRLRFLINITIGNFLKRSTYGGKCDGFKVFKYSGNIDSSSALLSQFSVLSTAK